MPREGNLRILMIAPDFKPNTGGVAEYVHQLATHLQSSGDSVTVFARQSAQHEDREYNYTVIRGDPGGTVHFSGAQHGVVHKALAACKNVREKAARLRAARPDVVWFTTVGYEMRDWAAACCLRRLPYVATLHGLDGNYYISGEGGWIDRLLLRHAKRILFDSDHIRHRFSKRMLPPRKCVALLPGVDFAALGRSPIDAQAVSRIRAGHTRIILTLCRLTPRKGVDTVLRALPAVLNDVPGAHLLVCGDGPERPRLEKLTTELGLSGKVSFAGRVPEPMKATYYSACDVFAMPVKELPGGDMEGFGIVYLEAAAFGKPAIAGDSGGAPDAVLDGKTGLVVEPGNPRALARGITRLLTDGEFARHLGEAGRQRIVEELNWANIAARAHAILEAAARSWRR